MSAQEEQMRMAATLHVNHVAFVLIIYSFAFLFYLFIVVLCSLYAYNAWPASASASGEGPAAGKGVKGLGLEGMERRNGHAINGVGGRRREEGMRGVEEFELEGLITDDEDEDEDEENILVAGKSRINGEVTEGANGRIRRKVNGRVE